MTFDYSAIWDNRDILFEGLMNTLLISGISIPVGILIGVFVCLLRISRSRLLRWPAIVFIELMRNIPLLIIIFMVFYALPFYGIRLSGLTTGLICLSVYGGAYFAEVFRGGVEAISQGQFDAAKALGLKYGFYMRRVIFPQIYQYVFPPGTNIALTMIKETSLLSMITVAELTYAASDINGRTFTPVETFATIAVIYWMLSTLFLKLTQMVQVRIDVETAKPAAALR
ncbi:amino acid ABC transporter permease [Roseibium album]|uniref:Putative glutamine ABC transporter permease protein GlnM n=1 Tax=Roseibium album TaxID=311410 RepID=A0A0M7AC40_9HYPH|nr:amino acid ABC transporter permease [Roseibium album]MBG6163081.1 His/Glu/Gln/Arg/opine family amino acid ABC transporter permease subunit [Labrenzia sp. EL_195]MBG6201381.1 His/Glu/Gln/Arg/opine family amino acid ABC transporter permease subunit [Labrenzia sp. EL_13]CTQ58579.1 putative glutamine ABC transporter permease protein GlnM [Roseibium album]CTQ66856.1 putative glutamine ABC transporter permease protein GlnM [Roseibium album]CTQ72012.1 putative glutamine ABC transporter permease pr